MKGGVVWACLGVAKICLLADAAVGFATILLLLH